jgi:hypothetical protein
MGEATCIESDVLYSLRWFMARPCGPVRSEERSAERNHRYGDTGDMTDEARARAETDAGGELWPCEMPHRRNGGPQARVAVSGRFVSRIGAGGTASAESSGELAEARMTAKITATMALDDVVKTPRSGVDRRIDALTMTASVRSRAEHDRALSLARETAGVARVVDHRALQSR